MAKLRMKERHWRPRWMPTILLPAGEPRPREAQVAQGRLPVHPASGYASPTARAARDGRWGWTGGPGWARVGPAGVPWGNGLGTSG